MNYEWIKHSFHQGISIELDSKDLQEYKLHLYLIEQGFDIS